MKNNKKKILFRRDEYTVVYESYHLSKIVETFAYTTGIDILGVRHIIDDTFERTFRDILLFFKQYW